MDRQPVESKARYRIIGIRRDGSTATLRHGMTWAEANRAKAVIGEPAEFASVHVEPDLSIRRPVTNPDDNQPHG